MSQSESGLTEVYCSNIRKDVSDQGSSDTIIPISIPVLVVASRRLPSSVSSAIRFLFVDMNRFMVESVTHEMCFQSSSAFLVR